MTETAYSHLAADSRPLYCRNLRRSERSRAVWSADGWSLSFFDASLSVRLSAAAGLTACACRRVCVDGDGIKGRRGYTHQGCFFLRTCRRNVPEGIRTPDPRLLYNINRVTEECIFSAGSGCGSVWLECLIWDQDVAGSNPVTPICRLFASESGTVTKAGAPAPPFLTGRSGADEISYRPPRLLSAFSPRTHFSRFRTMWSVRAKAA